MYKYRISPENLILFEVGYYNQDGVWITESLQIDINEAIRHTSHLNGEDIFKADETQSLAYAMALARVVELEVLGHALVTALEIGSAKLPSELAHKLHALMEYDFSNG